MKKNYLKPTALYEQAQERYEDICKVSRRIEERLAKYPKGKIRIVYQKQSIQYYLRSEQNDKSGKYISKQDESKIKLYLQKKYDETILNHLQLEKANLEKFLKKTKSSAIEIQNVYSNNFPDIKDKINPIDMSDEDFLKEWLSFPYTPKEMSVNDLSFISNRGEHVRSKSELMIANALDKYGVPYRYECPLLLSNGITIYPDFTILDVRRRREIFWEHRGMMDDREYARHTVKRIKDLEREGITLGNNLIITEEMSTIPLGTDEIKRVIKNKFAGIIC